jgi:N-acyl homoserine lactone hydrolase
MKRCIAPLLLVLCACATPVVETQVATLTPRSGPADREAWGQAFASPREISVVPLLTGEIRVKRSLLLDLSHPSLSDRQDGDRWVPVVAYLVRHPDTGDWLLDSGFDASFTDSGHGNFGGLARFVEVSRQVPGHDVVSLLQAAGADPARLSGVVLSHLHGDHTAGLPALPAGVPVIAGSDARRGHEVPWYAPFDHFVGRQAIEVLDFSAAPDQGPGPCLDLFGDGSLFVIATPGHAPGNLSVVVNGLRGPVLLTFDASHTREGFEAGIPPGKATDRAAAERTVARLRAFREAHPQLRVIAGHDAADWDMGRGVQDPL